MNSQEKRAAAERERLRDKKKEQTLSAILDKEGGHLIILIIGVLGLIVAGYSIFFE